mmetsp:Transcript_18605/g.44119  ORF Transcript_18605/g.44119 Transcript_18605/m.44119 type:complete len:141 (+) Transcript_18605:83-505(+)|eukprot:CAMPEP_0185813066 /NCGR_PEP_ID=MMETSP1322-20130828/10708_1 /TAXON_ID=265543 /ORGANISM="Minutocellus polymorphus, Strain RCC2270" /LENGTH=140 /DNA_ID=CAMNT_0028509687 /DNA_START=79 /DNA_END=501 /DNA_ORIENTATION=+
MRSSLITAAALTATATAASAFTHHHQVRPVPATRAEAAKFDPLGLAEEDATKPAAAATAAAAGVFATLAASPLAAVAESDDYEYGAVDAPIGIAWAAGAFAILTAAVPVFLQSGEKALEQQRIDEKGSFGTSKDILKKRR